MHVYILDADVNKYREIYYANEEDSIEFYRRFNGAPMRNRWTRNERFLFYPSRKRNGDTPGLTAHIPVFSPRAVLALGDLLEDNGELLRITCEGEEYYLLNVTRLVDALDEPNCQIVRFDDGRIMKIDGYSFVEEKLIGVGLFKVPQKPLGNVYVTDHFVSRVKAAKLKGFKFPRIWSTDT
jgi:hypothetical protein